MKKVLAFLLLVTSGLLLSYSHPRSRFLPEVPLGAPEIAHGQSSPAAAAGGPAFTPYPLNNPERLKGLWKEGKAVFSDVTALDVFLHDYYVRGYRPEQPIKFSHQQHVEKAQMECQYCHSGVAKSPFPTIPSVELCMGCHKLVKTESPEIQKLKKYYDEGKPVEWVPVMNLPEHVRFPHERHIKAGVGCQSCHGQMNRMQSAEKVSSLKMGWCLSCHRDKGATIDCSACHY